MQAKANEHARLFGGLSVEELADLALRPEDAAVTSRLLLAAQHAPMCGIIHTADAVPLSLRQFPIGGGGGRQMRVHKATYDANMPSEDRCTIVVDVEAGTLLAGVWDGHAGADCAEYVDRNVHAHYTEQLQQALESSSDDRDAGGRFGAAMVKAFQAVDRAYTAHAEASNDPKVMCAGTCACAVHVYDAPPSAEDPDSSGSSSGESLVTVANLGDSRAVAGHFCGRELLVEELSNDHSVLSSPSERARLREQFPTLPQIVCDDEEKQVRVTAPPALLASARLLATVRG